MKTICEAIALEELSDEDWKTQAARKYPNIPRGSIVNVLQEDYYNFYGGPWTRVEWSGNWYWVRANKLKKLISSHYEDSHNIRWDEDPN